MNMLKIVVLDYASATIFFDNVSQDYLDTWFDGDAGSYVFASKVMGGLGFNEDSIYWMCAPKFSIKGEL